MRTLVGHSDALRARAASAINPVVGLFALMMLMSTYDKSGVAVGLGGRDVSITLYKLIFVALALWMVAELLLRRFLTRVKIDRGLLKLIVAFVLVQTAASLIGGLLTPGEIPLSAEMYYFIQRAHFLFIPLIALKLRLSHRSVLALLIGAVLIHYAFIALQFVSPSTYAAFSQSVADPLRRDNSLGWTGESLDFIGLQTTGNYGTFAAALGFLALAFRSRNLPVRHLMHTMGWFAIAVAVLSPSRAVFIMTMTALLVFWMKTGVLSKLQASLVGVAVAAVAGLVTVVGSEAVLDQFKLPEVGAVYAFVDPERGAAGGSTYGKLIILQRSPEMVARSPVFGWGQRRFLDIAEVQGVGEDIPEFSHFYVLSMLLSSGVVGLLAYLFVTVGIARALWRGRGEATQPCAASSLASVCTGSCTMPADLTSSRASTGRRRTGRCGRWARKRGAGRRSRMIDLSVCIVNTSNIRLLKPCLESIFAHTRG